MIKSRLRLESTCLDLLDMADIDNPDFWTDSHNRFREMYLITGEDLPVQKPNIPGKRYLDCAFFDYIRTAFEHDSDLIGLIRSAFVEGNRIKVGETDT